MTDDTWNNRDLPVLKAAVEIHDQSGRNPSAAELGDATGIDQHMVQRALRALRGNVSCQKPVPPASFRDR
jgi:hypothetical protein